MCRLSELLWFVLSLKGISSVPSCAECRCLFFAILYWRNSAILSVPFMLQWTHWIFWVPGIIFSYISLFLLSAFLTGAPLVTDHRSCWFCTFRRSEIYQKQFFSTVYLFGKRFIWDRRLALGKPLNPSGFSLFSPYSPFVLHFVHCCNNCFYLTHNCLLLPPVHVLILMDPNGSPLQVLTLSEETTTVPYETTCSSLIPCRHPAGRSTALAAILPTCLGV